MSHSFLGLVLNVPGLGGGASAPAPAPDVAVTIDGSPVANGGNVDLGSTNWNTPLSETVTVSNPGTAELQINTDPPTSTEPDLVPSVFTDTAIAAAGSATFDLDDDASTAGDKTAQISFASNVPAKSPYLFNVSYSVLFSPSMLTSPVAAVDFHESGSSLFQDSAGTTPATANNDPIGRAAQISGFSATPAIQATTAAKPTLKTGANGINNHNAASFDGGDNLDWTGISAASGAKTIYVVANPNTVATSQQFFFDAETGRFLIAHLGATVGKVAWYDGSYKEPGNATTGNQILCFALGGGTGTIYRNNVQIGTGLVYVDKAIGGGVRIGSSYLGSAQFYTGLYGAIYIYNALHSASERAAMHAYLSARWGIS